MLKKIFIRNYALIDHLDIPFYPGFSTLTGETGSGKSILLGALGLAMGKRADKTAMRDPTRKCVVETEWDISNYSLENLFEANDWDYDAHCIIRREISPSGKSRAFVNDSPVSLALLAQLSGRLLDIHSQHQTTRLMDGEFQLELLDSWAGNGNFLREYREKYTRLRNWEKELEGLEQLHKEMFKELDYHTFLLEELDAAQLDGMDMDALEREKEELTHGERIRESLLEMDARMEDGEFGVLTQMRILLQRVEELASLSSRFDELSERMRSIYLEAADVQAELAPMSDGVDLDPVRLEELLNRIETINQLLFKHQMSELEELIEYRERLRSQVAGFGLNEERRNELAARIETLRDEVGKLALALSESRTAAIPSLIDKLEGDLKRLGMPQAKIRIHLHAVGEPGPRGTDRIETLFTANPGLDPQPLNKVASGGELSRIMLVLKSVMARKSQLPTLIFDEIDTGVSGEVSAQMGSLMREMGADMQVLSITHIPQIAAKGQQHYKVFKISDGRLTETRIEELNAARRIEEIAEMLSGKDAGDSARNHAEELLKAGDIEA